MNDQWIEKRDLDGSKISVEEEGGQCSEPRVHGERPEKTIKAQLYQQVEFKDYEPEKTFKLFFVHGTEREIEEQFQTIKSFEGKQKPPCMRLAFQNKNPKVKDCYVSTIPYCSEAIVLTVQVDNKICSSVSSPKNFFLIAELKQQSTSCLKGATDMRIPRTLLPAFYEFSLLCKTKSCRTPTMFRIIIKPVDGDQKETHAPLEICYPVCFDDSEAGGLIPGETDSQEKFILSDNFEEIKRMIKQVGKVIERLVDKEVLHEDFPETISLSLDKTSELLRHLCRMDNILPQFIQALQESGSNEELTNFLHQCIT